jgi:hypothetical protein
MEVLSLAIVSLMLQVVRFATKVRLTMVHVHLEMLTLGETHVGSVATMVDGEMA